MPTIDVGPGPLEYTRIDGGSPTLVFLHDGLGSLGLWRSFPADLCAATGCAGLVYSRHGHGASARYATPRTPRFMHDEGLVVLPELLRRLGVDGPVLVGHSDGASIGIVHASEHPVRGLVLMAPHVFVEDVTLAGIREARRAYDDGDLRKRLARHHADVDATFAGWAGVWLSDGFRGWSIEDAVASLACPALVVQGADDRYGTLAQVGAIERGAPGRVETLVLHGVGHAPHVERPQETLAAIAVFVRSL